MANGMYPSPPRHGLKYRPIERIIWDEDYAAASALAIQTKTKLTKGPEGYNQARGGPFSARSAGRKIGGVPLKAGTYNPFRIDQSFTGGIGGPPMSSGLD